MSGTTDPREEHTRDCVDYALIVCAFSGDDAPCICGAEPEAVAAFAFERSVADGVVSTDVSVGGAG